MPASTESPDDSIALLIDADNAPAAKIEFIITELATHGVVNVRRAYGNWTKRGLTGWTKVLHEYAIEPVQLFDMVKGKNGTDMRLLIDAMDMLYTKEVQTFALVSSDCDFTPLCTRLRADGKQVIGFGGQNTPAPFINACTRFLYLDDEAESSEQKKARKASGNQLKGNTKLMNTLRSAIDAAADDDGWASLGPVGAYISNQGPFDHRTYGFSKLSDLFRAIDAFEMEKLQNGNQTIFRVRRK
ncbi:MAG: NYN domain-containing protein [Verrucomicrobiales bacterium]|nr:NYN domain-containing protein [Verrucomicrobiales bacterium]